MKERPNLKDSKISILYTWTLFFLLLLVISLFISWFIYNRAISALSNEVAKSYQNEVDKEKYLVDEKLNEMKSIALAQSLSPDLQQLVNTKDVTPQFRIAMWQLQQKLRIYCISNLFINDIVIGFNDVDIAISNHSIYSIKEVSDILFSGEILPELQKRIYKNEFMILGNQSGSSDTPMIVYLLSIPLESGSKNNAFILVTMKTDALSQLTKEDNNRFVMLQSGNVPVDISNRTEIELSGFQTNIEDYRCFIAKSNLGDFNYLYYVPSQDFFSTVSKINNITIIALVFCILIFASLMILFLRINYNPLHRILLRINEQLTGRNMHATNELSYIERSLANIFSERQNMMGELSKNESELKKYFILKLLRGEFEEKPTDIMNQVHFNIASTGRRFIVAIFRLSYSIKYALDALAPTESVRPDQSLLAKPLDDAFGSMRVYLTDIDDCVVAIICCEFTAVDIAYEKLIKAKDSIKAYSGLELAMSVSQIVETTKDIQKAYNQSKEAMIYNQLLEQDFAVYTNVTAVKNPNVPNCIAEINKRFGNCIESGDFTAVIYMLEEVFGAYFNSSDTVSELKMNMFSLINIISSSLNNFIVLNNMHLNIDAIVYKLLNCKSINTLKKVANSEFTILIDSYKMYLNEQTSDLISTIQEYVSKNYVDYNLSVCGIANKFNLSAPYLSKIYKKEASIGLLEYIHNVRINEAKNMLSTSKYSIREIAESVGFNDSSAFIKLFKKHEGIPPGKYSKHQVS